MHFSENRVRLIIFGVLQNFDFQKNSKIEQLYRNLREIKLPIARDDQRIIYLDGSPPPLLVSERNHRTIERNKGTEKYQ